MSLLWNFFFSTDADTQEFKKLYKDAKTQLDLFRERALRYNLYDKDIQKLEVQLKYAISNARTLGEMGRALDLVLETDTSFQDICNHRVRSTICVTCHKTYGTSPDCVSCTYAREHPSSHPGSRNPSVVPNGNFPLTIVVEHPPTPAKMPPVSRQTTPNGSNAPHKMSSGNSLHSSSSQDPRLSNLSGHTSPPETLSA